MARADVQALIEAAFFSGPRIVIRRESDDPVITPLTEHYPDTPLVREILAKRGYVVESPDGTR